VPLAPARNSAPKKNCRCASVHADDGHPHPMQPEALRAVPHAAHAAKLGRMVSSVKSRGRRPREEWMPPGGLISFRSLHAQRSASSGEEADRPARVVYRLVSGGRCRCRHGRLGGAARSRWHRGGMRGRRCCCRRRIGRSCRRCRCGRATRRGSASATARVVASANGQANTGDCDTKCRAIHDFLLT